jgi:predicted nucleic acid-binding protein
MVIIDTTVWIDYLEGTRNAEADWLGRESTQQRLGLTDLILCEILQGICNPASFVQVRDDLLGFEVFPTGGSALAIAAAWNYRELRRRGHTVRKTIDCLIATFCLRSGHSLLHRNRDFDPFEKILGLNVVRP